MKRILYTLAALLAASLVTAPAQAQTTMRVGWCAKTVSSAAAPFAIATKMGWFAKDGIAVQLVPLPGSTDCVKMVATKDVMTSLPSVEPVAVIKPQGVNIRVYYTAYQGNIYGIRVPKDSPVKSIADLKGKKIGVTSMASAGVIIARSIVAANGMNPDKDVQVVVAGEGAQTAALLNAKQVDALSQFDTQYALVENAGAELRALDTKDIDRFPSNGLIALEETMKTNKKELVALAQGYARGTVFAMNNPEAAIRILWEVFPQTKATGKTEADAMRDDVKTLMARAANWDLRKVGAKQWGESLEGNYSAYMDFLLKWGLIKTAVAGKDVISNEWIAEINKFDAKKLAEEAKAYKYK